MTHPRPAEQNPGFTHETVASPAEVYELCKNEVRQGILDVQAQLESDEPFIYDGGSVSSVLHGEAIAAAESGDQARVESYITTLFKLPYAYPFARVEACFAGMRLGSQRAFDMLRGALEAEKYNTQKIIAAAKQLPPGALRPAIIPELIETIVSTCQQQDLSPDSWIDEYAADNEWRWSLRGDYHARAARLGDPEQAAHHREQLDAVVAELADDTLHTAAFVYDKTWLALNCTKDPGLRLRLVERFERATSETVVTPGSFRQYIVVGEAILQDPELATLERVAWFEQNIQYCVEVLQDAGYGDYDAAQDQMSWRLPLKRFYGATPEEQAETIELTASRMLSTDVPDEADSGKNMLRNKDFAMRLIDGQLANAAERYAREGDFAATRLFLSKIGNQRAHGHALRGCLERATAPEQIEQLKPGEMTLAFNLALGAQFEYAAARLSGDYEKMAAYALECARNPAKDDGVPADDYIQSIHTLITEHDEQQGASLAKELLSIMRTTKPGYASTLYLSEALIRAGDTEEPARLYTQIAQTSRDPSVRLRGLNQLAILLESVAIGKNGQKSV